VGINWDDRLDHQSRAVLNKIPPALGDMTDIPAARQARNSLTAAMLAVNPDILGVDTEDHQVPGVSDNPDVMVRVYTPSKIRTPAPGFYWIHGGAMVVGNVSMDNLRCKAVALETDCVVASVEYRLAPEHPHPAPIEDCYAGLKWFFANAQRLGVDRSRIAVGGASAGGGLAASLALLARDRAELEIAFQQLIYPMLDDRNVTPSSHYIDHPKMWIRQKNIAAWSALLGRPAGSDDVSPYASPARAEDLSGLPPAFIIVGEFDMFLDEDIEYAQRLTRAGVPTELHVFPGAFHGSDRYLPKSPTTKRWAAVTAAALRQALHG
jgi:acetyl esterase/lipase